MFDDQMNKKATQEVEDILSQTDGDEGKGDAVTAAPANLPVAPAPQKKPIPKQVPKSAASVGSPPSSAPIPKLSNTQSSGGTVPPMPPKSDVSNVFKIIVIVVVSLGFFAAALYLGLRIMTPNNSMDDVQEQEVEQEVQEQEDQVLEEEEEKEVVQDEAEELDSDGDGLTDVEEAEIGTDLFTADTDQDGLGDREEVKVYGTDPFDADTDEDGYLDGQEVASGYNPNGEGKLFELPK